VNDILKLCTAITNADKVLKQYKRDSGRMVRRSHVFPTESYVVENHTANQDRASIYGYGGLGWTPSFARSFDVGSGPLSDWTVTTRSKSFSGAYVYYVNKGSDADDRVARYAQFARKLLGIRLDPEVLWNLSPWSWLADWQWNIGDILSNASALGTDSLVIKYGYLMRRTESTRTRMLDGISTYYDGPIGPVISRFGAERKERIKATPYGFGANTSAFSPKQWSILAALGMCRSPNSLRTSLG